jgi:hypothetical protein
MLLSIHCREFTKRINPDLPFYANLANERFSTDDASFDNLNNESGDHTYEEQGARAPRLHRLQRNSREDASIVVAGRACLPARNKAHLRQKLYKPEAGLPPVPNNLKQYLPSSN